MQQRLAQLRRLRRRALKCQPLRYSQRRRKKRAKALFCSNTPALVRSSGDDSKAAHLRQPLLWRRRPDPRCFYLLHQPKRMVPAQAFGDAALPWASSRSGAEPGL